VSAVRTCLLLPPFLSLLSSDPPLRNTMTRADSRTARRECTGAPHTG
jgi:hypothetical protein